MKVVLYYLCVCFLGTVALQAQWNQQYFRGYVNLLYADSTQLYCAVDSSRIYRSTDFGATWVERNNGLPGSAIVHDFVMKNNVITVATEASSVQLRGLYRSTDNGLNWSRLTSAPAQNYTLLRLIDSTYFAGYTDFGGNPLRYSTDGGLNWFQATGLGTSSKVTSIIKTGSSLFLATDIGVYSSLTGGSSWVKVNSTGLPANTSFNKIISGNTNKIFGYTNSYSTPAMYISSDNGVSWSAPLNTGLPQGAYIKEVDYYHAILYALVASGGPKTRLFSSTDFGNTWNEINTTTLKNFSDKYFQNGFLFAAAGQMFYAATEEGMFKSANNGVLWTECSSGIRYNGYMTQLASATGYVFGWSGTALYSNSVYPGGFTLVQNFPFNNLYLQDFVSINNVVYASNSQRAYRTTDAGVHWDSVNFGPQLLMIEKMAVGNNAVYALGQKSNGYKYIYRSTTNGDTWDTTRIALVDYVASVTPAFNRIYAATFNSVFESNDGMTAWIPYGVNGLPPGYNIQIAYPATASMVLVGTPVNQAAMYICYTTNRGASWSKARVQIGSVSGDTIPTVKSIITVNGTLLAGTAGGVFISTDNGKTWSQFQNGMGALPVQALQYTGKYVVASTAYYSVWYISASQILGTEKAVTAASSCILEQNYPNPFNPATTIAFKLSSAGKVTLRIYNQLGELITELVNSELSAGYHSVNWNAVDCVSGVYFYELSAGGAKISKKLLLLK